MVYGDYKFYQFMAELDICMCPKMKKNQEL